MAHEHIVAMQSPKLECLRLRDQSQSAQIDRARRPCRFAECPLTRLGVGELASLILPSHHMPFNDLLGGTLQSIPRCNSEAGLWF